MRRDGPSNGLAALHRPASGGNARRFRSPSPSSCTTVFAFVVSARRRSASWVRQRNMELQFWGYELGNVVAAIAGAGGFLAFLETVNLVVANRADGVLAKTLSLAGAYPDATVTIGLGVLVLSAPCARALALRARGPGVLNGVDLVTTLLALGILAYALSREASWISVAGSCFVVGSCCLRRCHANPLLLKLGGLALALGGVGLTVYGAWMIRSAAEPSVLATGALTAVTGFYVVCASLLTYEGGVYQCGTWTGEDRDGERGGWLSLLLHPVDGVLARRLLAPIDRRLLVLNERAVKPAIFWVSADTKQARPFKTSMLARLPWRLATGTAAAATLTPEGIAFAVANVGWAIGDVAIGVEDW